MSLEEQLSALVSAIEANTDAQLQLASAIRGQLATAPQTDKAPTTGNAPVETPKPRGRPRNTTPPPSPADLASTESKAPAPPAPTPTPPSATPASAPAAGSGSAAGPDFEKDYAELAAIVPEFAAKHGKGKTIAVFTEMGFTSGVELKAKAPARIGEAVRLFREKL